MRIYDSLSQKIKSFKPRDNEVSIYVCGITPYDTTHLGHAFTYTSIDIFVRYLESQGLKVQYAQNVTDIDDDILRKATEVGEDWRALGDRWTAHFISDMIALNVRPPDYFPRATEYIGEIIIMVGDLLKVGVAYESGGSVYYEVDCWNEFGKLCGLSDDEMLSIANERGNFPDDLNKRNPLDFVLWQAQAPSEPAWDSPWGPGRPGWHIECSTMSTRLLGNTVDFHSGGSDLSFPHHECEIAQVEPINRKKPFVRFWMHIAMVYYEGEKMSKSLKNLVMVHDLLKDLSPDAIRLYLGCHHYRDSWSFDKEDLKQAAHWAEKIRKAVVAEGGEEGNIVSQPYWVDFIEAMENDLDTPRASEVMVSLANAILEAVTSGQNVGDAKHLLGAMASIFGLRLGNPMPEVRIQAGWDTHLKEFS